MTGGERGGRAAFPAPAGRRNGATGGDTPNSGFDSHLPDSREEKSHGSQH